MIGIVDYGLGNLHSVKNALDYLGRESVVSSDLSRLGECAGLILPGVGAFPDAMKRLGELKMEPFLREYSEKRPLLGICLGMQLLFERSYEFGDHDGLGLIKGEVIRLTAADADTSYKIPHMGWNSLEIRRPRPLFANVPDGCYVYFVHSYKCCPSDPDAIAAATQYGEEICAAAAYGNVYGTQFHPEKSGEGIGLRILDGFASLCV